MATLSSERYVLLNRLADEFAERYRRGERPSLQEYVDRYPDLADEIREYFAALAEVEQVKENRREVEEPPPHGPLPPLERLGDCRIIREIGHGGMGVVYEAEQVSLAGTSPSKSCPNSSGRTPGPRVASSARRRLPRSCTTPISCLFSASANITACATTSCNSFRDWASTWSWRN